MTPNVTDICQNLTELCDGQISQTILRHLMYIGPCIIVIVEE